MQTRQHILNELQEISPFLAELPAVMPYSVPSGYFEAFSGPMLVRVGETFSLPVSSMPQFGIPEGYFDGFADQVLARIKAMGAPAELTGIAPVLAGLNRENVFTVPEGYFEQAGFSAAAAKQAPARVITMRRANKWMQYAAAAMMAGVLVTGAFLFTDNRTNYDNEQDFDISSELNKVSAAELVTYLNNPEHAIAAPSTTASAAESDLSDVKDNLSKLSDDELSQYLKENAGPFDSVIEKE